MSAATLDGSGQPGSYGVRFTAEAGERNTVLYSIDIPPMMPAAATWTVSDASDPVTAGAGCMQADDHTARCEASAMQQQFPRPTCDSVTATITSARR